MSTLQAPARPVTVPGRCFIGAPVCGKPARLFPGGWRCAEHVAMEAEARRRAYAPSPAGAA